MGRGSSKVGGGSGGSGSGLQAETQVMTQGGIMLNLSRTPLMYGSNDSAISGAQRTALEAQENKRLSAKTEYGLIVDANGNAIGAEVHGGRGSVRLPYSSLINPNAEVLTHNHPRGKGEVGELGGTFSGADLSTFSRYPNMKTIRASAAEGTYSMTKGPNFNAKAFDGYQKQVSKARQAQMDQASKALMAKAHVDIPKGLMTYTDVTRGQKRIFNEFLINVHNDLIAGQKQYGYSYTLERRQ